jgi:glycosyltransferase involved in cell wall biosynthesis
MTTPHISVLIDTYNHERYIEQAIVSVLEQDFPADEVEIVVVDDGSTDSTSSIIEKFLPRLRYIRKKNGGQASAFNAGIPELRGPIVAFLDGDDWWAKEKLSAVAATFEANPKIAAVGHGFYEVRDTEPAREMIVPAKPFHFDLSSVEEARLAGRGITFLGTSRLSVRREALNRIGPIPEELVFCADTPILALALGIGGAVILDSPLCYYRLHARNMCAHDPNDIARLRRNFKVTEVFLKCIPERLSQLGYSIDVSEALLGWIRIQMERSKLQLGEGGRWDVLRTELQRFRTHYQHPTVGYAMFKGLVGACALLLPPQRFYQLLNWYDRHNVKRIRTALGKAEPRVPPAFFQRLPVPEGADQTLLDAGGPKRR